MMPFPQPVFIQVISLKFALGCYGRHLWYKYRKILTSGKLCGSCVSSLVAHILASHLVFGRCSSWVLFLFLHLVVLNPGSFSYHNDFFVLPIALYFYGLVPLVITIRRPNLVLLYAYEETDSDAKIIHRFLQLFLLWPTIRCLVIISNISSLFHSRLGWESFIIPLFLTVVWAFAQDR